MSALGRLAVLPVVAAAAFAAGVHVSSAAAPACKTPKCLLTQFKRCHSASYAVSKKGVLMTFSVANADGHCFVSVQPAHGVSGFCAKLQARGSSVVAVNCTGGSLPKTIKL